MVELTDFTEIYKDALCVDDSYKQINAICQHVFHCNRFNPNNVKKLYSFVKKLTESNDNIKIELDKIQSGFDNLDTQVIIFIHNLERIKKELARFSELQEEEFNKMKIDNDIVEKDEKDDIFS